MLLTCPSSQVQMREKLKVASASCAGFIWAKRHSANDGGVRGTYDPRFIVFEYMFEIMLRVRQDSMVKVNTQPSP